MDGSNDVALYSGLGAGIIAVAILVVAVMLYRKNHSEYGVDVIDSSALAGGFQSFNFKTTRQGERDRERERVPSAPRWHTPTTTRPKGDVIKDLSGRATPSDWWHLFAWSSVACRLPICSGFIPPWSCPSILTDLLLCYFDARDNQSLIETAAAPPPPSGPHIWLSGSQSPPSDYTGLNHWWINVGVMEQWTSIHFLLCTAITSVGYVTAAVPASFRYRHSYYCHWHFWVSASDSHRGEGWSIVAAAVTAPVRRSAGAHAAPRLPQGPASRSNPAPSSGCVWGKRRAGRRVELGRHSAGHQSYLNRPALLAACLLCPPPATITPLCSHLFQPVRGATWNVEHFPGASLYWRLPGRFILAYFCCDRIVNILPSFS